MSVAAKVCAHQLANKKEVSILVEVVQHGNDMFGPFERRHDFELSFSTDCSHLIFSHNLESHIVMFCALIFCEQQCFGHNSKHPFSHLLNELIFTLGNNFIGDDIIVSWLISKCELLDLIPFYLFLIFFFLLSKHIYFIILTLFPDNVKLLGKASIGITIFLFLHLFSP